MLGIACESSPKYESIGELLKVLATQKSKHVGIITIRANIQGHQYLALHVISKLNFDNFPRYFFFNC